MLIKYDTNNHSVFLLNYHLVLVTKYRKKVITPEILKRVKEIFTDIGELPRYQIEIQEINSDLDHIHIIFKAQPKSEISKFLNAFKSASSRLVQKEFPETKKELYNNQFWSKSFFLSTAGGVGLDVLKEYVQQQGMNNK